MSKIGKGHADIVGGLVTGEPTKGRISIAKPAIMANQGHGDAGLLDDTAKECHIARKNDRIKAIGAQPGVYLHLADLTCASEIISIQITTMVLRSCAIAKCRRKNSCRFQQCFMLHAAGLPGTLGKHRTAPVLLPGS
ncbi:hypothetical protein [Labrys sp. WJW]|uniref:hypothetical protein n=1 Tax=Labrys sp. WJW TaxID=1737983 RepID=UPI001FD98F34|nr:hypothetical protein [Labrys sp. WJW]